jgi:uncharacterized low-complexity protein
LDVDTYGVGVAAGFTLPTPVTEGVAVASSAADNGGGEWTPGADDGVITSAYASGEPAHAALAAASDEGGCGVKWAYDSD